MSKTLDMSAQLNRHTKQGESVNQKSNQKASGYFEGVSEIHSSGVRDRTCISHVFHYSDLLWRRSKKKVIV